MEKEQSVLIPRTLLSVREEGREYKDAIFILEETQTSGSEYLQCIMTASYLSNAVGM